MSKSPAAQAASTREAVLNALKASDQPLDSYQLAKAARISPMQAWRTVHKLFEHGQAATDDPLETVNDLAARFRHVGQGGAAAGAGSRA